MLTNGKSRPWHGRWHGVVLCILGPGSLSFVRLLSLSVPPDDTYCMILAIPLPCPQFSCCGVLCFSALALLLLPPDSVTLRLTASRIVHVKTTKYCVGDIQNPEGCLVAGHGMDAAAAYIIIYERVGHALGHARKAQGCCETVTRKHLMRRLIEG